MIHTFVHIVSYIIIYNTDISWILPQYARCRHQHGLLGDLLKHLPLHDNEGETCNVH
jgi:hypothetical protein